MHTTVHDHLDELQAADWNALTGADNPFLRHEFLGALERHRCAAPETGWMPRHITCSQDGALVGAMPCYLKEHSWGEFVFDFAWADAYERYGRRYYPKLVCAVPYTPATGPRLLTHPESDREAVAQALIGAATDLATVEGLSSAHWLFPFPPQHRHFAQAGLSQRLGCQFHWHNHGYTDFDHFLAAFSSKKRKNVNRERRLARETGIEIHILHGPEIGPAMWSAFHDFYRDTFYRHGNMPLLSLEFFRDLGETMGEQVVMIAGFRAGQPVAASLFLRGADTLYGRYWGASEHAEGLHFEICYYQGIDYCIRNGLSRFEPGAQGEHKISRGFLPTETRSYHWIPDPVFRHAIDDFLKREARMMRGYIEEMNTHSPYRQSHPAR